MIQKSRPSKEKHFYNFLEQHIGKRIFLNADDLKPYTLASVHDDCIQLTRSSEANGDDQTFVIPYSAIVSLQEVEGLGGLVVYLVK